MKTAVEDAVNDRFSKKGMGFGEDISPSNIGAVINAVEGVSYCDIVYPATSYSVDNTQIADIVVLSVTIKGTI